MLNRQYAGFLLLLSNCRTPVLCALVVGCAVHTRPRVRNGQDSFFLQLLFTLISFLKPGLPEAEVLQFVKAGRPQELWGPPVSLHTYLPAPGLEAHHHTKFSASSGYLISSLHA